MLEIRGLHAGYGRVPVLRGIDLSVAPGEIVLVLGPNGAGKSTLLRSVGGFIRPTAGRVLLVEHDLALVWKVADRITVLDAGLVVAEGPPAAIAADTRVRALFTGSPVDA